MLIFFLSLRQSYLLFHTIVELISIIVAFAVFIITWNSRKILDNNYLFLVGVSYFFIGSLDLLHTLTFKGMQVIGDHFYANQFWVATRFLECVTLFLGFWLLDRKKKISADFVFFIYTVVTALIVLSILDWKIFPVCFIEGEGQTAFKIYAEYTIILVLLGTLLMLRKRRGYFTKSVYSFLFFSIIFAIISEFCFTLYISNYSISNQIGHYAKLISFYLIYKANVQTGIIDPGGLIFKNLRDREEQYRTLTENLPEMIMRFDSKFRCVYSNSAVRKLLPAVCPDIVGLQYSDLQLPAEISRILTVSLAAAAKTGKSQVVNFDLKVEGANRFYSLQIVPEPVTEGEAETYLMICFDITTLKHVEQELMELNTTKDKFFSIIAHDLKNPFTSLLGYSQLLAKSASNLSSDRIQQLAERLNESARQTYTLLENLLNWARIQTRNLSPVKRPLLPEELVEEARRICEPVAVAKGIDIVADRLASAKVMADRQMINTVFRNLINNAIKFSFPGGNIQVGAEDMRQYVLFYVSDSGTGIEDSVKEKILRIDSAFSRAGTANEKGTGLGLILCKEFVELHGGKIWFESQYNHGTTFYFTLPVSSAATTSAE
ncbi:MASE3 domain-containing protein [Arcticibacter sp. MXS-1]|uniref:sensor histidine kinase n=1 Tax=Arcticibacter sp. MXS-1 TaxID=3341726 RepID=UPI0035A87473